MKTPLELFPPEQRDKLAARARWWLLAETSLDIAVPFFLGLSVGTHAAVWAIAMLIAIVLNAPITIRRRSAGAELRSFDRGFDEARVIHQTIRNLRVQVKPSNAPPIAHSVTWSEYQ